MTGAIVALKSDDVRYLARLMDERVGAIMWECDGVCTEHDAELDRIRNISGLLLEGTVAGASAFPRLRLIK